MKFTHHSETLKYSLRDFSVGQTHLAGASLAQRHMYRLRVLITTALKAHTFIYVILDFGGVDTVTASYARHTMGWLLQSGEQSAGYEGEQASWDAGDGTTAVALPIYPFAMGLNADVREELSLALTKTIDLRLCFLEATEFSEASVVRGQLIGDLDKSLLETLTMILEYGEASASQLHQEASRLGRGGISATGWNNRLADLHRLRLLRRRREGRNWIYFPVIPTIDVNK